MSAFFTPCSVSGCPRNTAGYCYKCDPKPYFRDLSPKRAAGQGYQSGFQAGLKWGAEIAMRKMVEYALSEKECLSPFAAGAKKEFSAMAEAAEEIQNLIMKEAEGEQH